MAPVLLTESADRWRRCYLLSRQMICTVVAQVLLTESADRWRRCYLLSRQMICTVVAPVLLTESADRWRRCYLLSLQIDGAGVTYWVCIQMAPVLLTESADDLHSGGAGVMQRVQADTELLLQPCDLALQYVWDLGSILVLVFTLLGRRTRTASVTYQEGKIKSNLSTYNLFENKEVEVIFHILDINQI